MMDLSYSDLENEIYNNIGEKAFLVLSTSYKDRVTSRTMSFLVIDKKFYFQTDDTFLKFEQIKNNPNVSLCINNIQIEGVAKILGHPFQETNKQFLEHYKNSFLSSFKNYSALDREVVISIEPVFITLWKYEGNKPLRDFLDIKNKKAYREYYLM